MSAVNTKLQRTLNLVKYKDRKIIESNVFGNIAYEAAEGNICMMMQTKAGLHKVYGSATEMQSLATELEQITKMWGCKASE